VNQAATVFSFPSLEEFLNEQRDPSARNAAAEDRYEHEREEAIRQGYEEGLAQGRAAAEAELAAMREAARQEAADAARAEGPIAALGEALAQLEVQQREAAHQIESFGTELALAIVARLVAVDSVRADFIARLMAIALKQLAPERPQVIYVSSADHALLNDLIKDLPVKEDETLAPGQARIEAGSLFVEGAIERAFAQIKTAVLEVRARRAAKRKKE
jgi:flagellar assembly protein FliH